jgi:D-sedoheptulose 7-phosphate isomerase
MQQAIAHIIEQSISTKQQLLQNAHLLAAIEAAVQQTVECFSNGNRVWMCGNGGSAADAQHLAAEFSGRFYKNRKALPAEALHCNTSYVTAVANDYSYDVIYSRLVEGITQPGDMLWGFSTSGNSTNIVKAFETAKTVGVHTLAFTGEHGGQLKEISNILVNVPSTVTPRIQESHILIGHIICELVEARLFP